MCCNIPRWPSPFSVQVCEQKQKQKFLYHGQMGTKPSTSTFGSLMNAMKRTPIKFRNPSNTNSFYWGGKVSSSKNVRVNVRIMYGYKCESSLTSTLNHFLIITKYQIF